MAAPDAGVSIGDLAREVRASRDYARLLAAVPYARWLGLSMEDAPGGALHTRMAFRDPLVGNALLPALHGGTLGALLESAATFELLLRADTERLPKVISITVDFLRTARPQDTWARAHVTRLGRRVANVRVEAWQEDAGRPVATAHALFLLKERKGA